jgi:predicted anti-sigma-YlaC factor YlaD
VAVARLGLVMVAVAQILAAIPELLGSDPGASVHVAHEQGSWAVALAVGLLVVAVRPGRAVALLPVVAALVTGLAITMALDISAGRTQAAAEAPHGLAFLGFGLLWLLSRQASDAGGARRAAPVATPRRTGWAS